jgi:hypothetical protein
MPSSRRDRAQQRPDGSEPERLRSRPGWDMVWPLLSAAGFVLAVVLVIVLARARTASWERERAVAEESERRRRARQRAHLAKSAMVAASTVRHGRWHGAQRARRSPGPTESLGRDDGQAGPEQ